MENRNSELEKLEMLVESFSSMGSLTQVMQNSYSRLESEYKDVNSRLARVNELLRNSLAERNRLALYLSNILESLESGVIVTDKAGIIGIFNSTAARYCGLAAENVLGKKYTELQETGLPLSAMDEILFKGGSKTGEVMLSSSREISFPVAYTITRLRRPNEDDLAGLVVILYNLTDIKILEDNLKRVSTLAALGEMAATVAHEIRNPLSGISGFTALLLRDLEKGSDARRLVEKIGEGVTSLNAIVASLLNYTRSVTPDVSEVNPVDVVEGALSELKSGADFNGHSIELIAGSRRLKAHLDPHLFRMVVFNLVKNAVQASPDGGLIRLTLTSGVSGEIDLSVEDDGPGISEDVREKLFTPFFTTKTNGTGLGLATVKKLTELHGGRVMAENRSEGGARFTIRIPGLKAKSSHEA